MILSRRVSTAHVTVCRHCGQALGRSAMNSTLWKGWWGVVSFFANLGFIAGNAAALWRVGLLAPPRDGGTPLTPGGSIFARSGIWFVAAVSLVVIGMATMSEDPTPSTYTPPGSSTYDPTSDPPVTSQVGWTVGACVDVVGSSVGPVPCSAYPDGRIVDQTYSDSACPISTDSYVQDGARVWCIDEQ